MASIDVISSYLIDGSVPLHLYHSSTKWWRFFFICVCPSVVLSMGGGVPCTHYPWCIGPHMALSPNPTLLPVRGREDRLSPLVTFDGHHWRPVQTCSLQDLMAVTSSGCWSRYDHCKRALRILLDYFLVLCVDSSSQISTRLHSVNTKKLSILKSFFNFLTSNFPTMISGHLQIWVIWVFFKWHSSESGMIHQRCVIKINVDLFHKEVDLVKIWKFYHYVWLGIYLVWFETINTYPGVVKNSAKTT